MNGYNVTKKEIALVTIDGVTVREDKLKDVVVLIPELLKSNEQKIKEYAKHMLEEYEEVGDFIDGLCPVKKNGLWGFISLTGRLVIPCSYEKVIEHKYGLAIVADRYGVVTVLNSKNAPLISCEDAKFSKIRNCKHLIIKKSSKTYLMDITGNIISKGYDSIEVSISHRVYNTTLNKKVGLLNLDGTEFIPDEYQEIFHSNTAFFPAKKDDGWGVIDTNNNIKIPFMYQNAFGPVNGLITVQSGGKWWLVDEKGTPIFTSPVSMYPNFTNKHFVYDTNAGSVFIDKETGQLQKKNYTNVSGNHFGDPTMAKQNGFYGYIDDNLDVAIEFKYDYAESFSNDVAIVAEGLYGLIDTKGEYILKPTYKRIETTYNENLCYIATLDNDYKIFLDKSGQPVDNEKYIKIERLNNGLFYVQKQLAGPLTLVGKNGAPVTKDRLASVNDHGWQHIIITDEVNLKRLVIADDETIIPHYFSSFGSPYSQLIKGERKLGNRTERKFFTANGT